MSTEPPLIAERPLGPLVSVVIPAYGAEAFIEETLSSVRQQDHRPVEVVVIEDCSPDRTAEIVQALADSWSDGSFRVRLFRQPANMGGAAALARGFREAEGEYLCWLSADDAFVGQTKLSEQVSELAEKPGISYARSFYRGPNLASVGPDELVTATWRVDWPVVERLMLLFPRARLMGLLFVNPINGSTVMMDRHTWRRCGNFDAALRNIDQDSDMWMRYSALGVRISSISTPAGFYRIHPGQTSNLREDCLIGAAATRIRMLMAYETVGRLRQLLSRTWPILAFADRWGWYRSRPLVADYLCEVGLLTSRNPAARYFLGRIRTRLESERLVDARLANVARAQARETSSSEEFARFVEAVRSA